jgi:riboflavin synthase alpha subunit
VARKPGDRINIETDILARYVDQLLRERDVLPTPPAEAPQ